MHIRMKDNANKFSFMLLHLCCWFDIALKSSLKIKMLSSFTFSIFWAPWEDIVWEGKEEINMKEISVCWLDLQCISGAKHKTMNIWTTTAPILSCPDLSSASGSRHLFWCIWVTLIPCQEDMTVNAACKTSENCQEPSFIHAEHNSCMTYAGETVCWVSASSYHCSFTQTTCWFMPEFN